MTLSGVISEPPPHGDGPKARPMVSSVRRDSGKARGGGTSSGERPNAAGAEASGRTKSWDGSAATSTTGRLPKAAAKEESRANCAAGAASTSDSTRAASLGRKRAKASVLHSASSASTTTRAAGKRAPFQRGRPDGDTKGRRSNPTKPSAQFPSASMRRAASRSLDAAASNAWGWQPSSIVRSSSSFNSRCRYRSKPRPWNEWPDSGTIISALALAGRRRSTAEVFLPQCGRVSAFLKVPIRILFCRRFWWTPGPIE